MLSNCFFSKIVNLMRFCWKTLYSRTRHRWQYGAWALLAGYLRLQTHTQCMGDLLLFHCNNGCTKAPQCYVIRTLPVSFWIETAPLCWM